MTKKKAEHHEKTTAAAPPPAAAPPEPVAAPAEAPHIVDAEVLPAWTPSKDFYLPPDWVIRAQRFAWKVTDIDAEWKRVFDEKLPTGRTERAQWTSQDIEYSYFAGGKVLARFREGVYGVLKTVLVEAFEPKPEAETPGPTV